MSATIPSTHSTHRRSSPIKPPSHLDFAPSQHPIMRPGPPTLDTPLSPLFASRKTSSALPAIHTRQPPPVFAKEKDDGRASWRAGPHEPEFPVWNERGILKSEWQSRPMGPRKPHPPSRPIAHVRLDLPASPISFPSPVIVVGPEGLSSASTNTSIDSAYYSRDSRTAPRARAYGDPASSAGSHSISSMGSSSHAHHHVVVSENAEESSAAKPKGRRLSRMLEPLTRRMRKDSHKEHKIELPTFTRSVVVAADPVALPKNVLKVPRRSSRHVSRDGDDSLIAPASPPPLPEFRVGARDDGALAPRRRSPLPSQDATTAAIPSSTPAPSSALLTDLPPRQKRPVSAGAPVRRPYTSSGFAPRPDVLLTPAPVRTVRMKQPKRPSTAPAMMVESPPTIEEHRLPSQRHIAEAASLYVTDQTGTQVRFGDLFLGQKTVVVFIRHFWCPLCQDYMFSLSRIVNPAVLKKAGVSLVVIGNGSHSMIRAYRKIFRMKFALYTDPLHKVYHALGMTLRTLEAGPESQRGAYVRHGTVSGIAMVVVNAVKVGMPVWKEGGDIEQLGGEFVLGPGLQCTFAHRMLTTRTHAPIQRVLSAAGIDVFARWEQNTPIDQRFPMSEADQAQWMVARKRSLTKLRERKSYRRGMSVAFAEGVPEGTESFCGSVNGEVCEVPPVPAPGIPAPEAADELAGGDDMDTASVKSSCTSVDDRECNIDDEVAVVTEVAVIGHVRKATLEVVGRLSGDTEEGTKLGLTMLSVDGHASSQPDSPTTNADSETFSPVEPQEDHIQRTTPVASDSDSAYSVVGTVAEEEEEERPAQNDGVSISLDAYPFTAFDASSIISSGSGGSYWDHLEQNCGTDEA